MKTSKPSGVEKEQVEMLRKTIILFLSSHLKGLSFSFSMRQQYFWREIASGIFHLLGLAASVSRSEPLTESFHSGWGSIHLNGGLLISSTSSSLSVQLFHFETLQHLLAKQPIIFCTSAVSSSPINSLIKTQCCERDFSDFQREMH